MDRTTDEFVKLLTASQSTIYACIVSLLPDRVAANDVLQETNLTLWHKADTFESGTNFAAWACQIARYQVLSYRRKQRKDRLIFDDDLFEQLCDQQSQRIPELSRYSELLRGCLGKLKSDQRELLEERYSIGSTVKQVAKSLGKSENAISLMLYRIRESLLICVKRHLNEATS